MERQVSPAPVWEAPTAPTAPTAPPPPLPPLSSGFSPLKPDPGSDPKSPVPEVTDEVWVVHLHLLHRHVFSKVRGWTAEHKNAA